MSDAKKDLKLERELVSCGFTQKDITAIYEAADSLSPDDVKRRVKTLSISSIIMALVIFVSAIGIFQSIKNSNEDMASGVILFFIIMSVFIFIINYFVPFKVGIKASVFFLKKNKLGQ